MVITNQQAGLGTAGQEVPRAATGDDAGPMAARLTTGGLDEELCCPVTGQLTMGG
jgi:hypothetical protein